MATPAVHSNTSEPNTTAKTSNDEEAECKKFDIVGHLPVEIVELIYSNLSGQDLYSAISCCLSWYVAVKNNEYFWEAVCLREGYTEVEESNRSEFYSNFFKRHNYWEGLYLYNANLQRNWETNNYREAVYDLGEPDKYFHWCLFDGVFACQGLTCNKFFIFEPYNEGLKTTVVTMKTDDIRGGFKYKRGKYFTFYNKSSVKVWDLDNGTIVVDELWENLHFVHAYKNFIVLLIESYGQRFHVINCETGQIEFEYRDRYENLAIMSGKIAFTTMDLAINVLNWEDKSLVTFTCCHKSQSCNHTILIKDDLLLSLCIKEGIAGTRTTKLLYMCVWDITTKTKLRSTFMGSQYDYENASFMNKYLCLQKSVYSRFGKSIVIELWDYTKGVLAFSIDEQFPLRRIKNDQFIIGTRSSQVAMWCLRTGDFVWDLNLPLNFTECKYDIIITDTKLMYYTYKKSSKVPTVHIRDFEI